MNMLSVQKHCPWVLARTRRSRFTIEQLEPSTSLHSDYRVRFVNQHSGPLVRNKEKLKINLLTGESLG